MIIVTGSVVCRHDAIDEALRVSLAHVRRSRQEPGCLLHSVNQDAENRYRLVFLEHWADRDALAAHFAVPASSEFVTTVAALAESPPSMEVYEATKIRL